MLNTSKVSQCVPRIGARAKKGEKYEKYVEKEMCDGNGRCISCGSIGRLQ